MIEAADAAAKAGKVEAAARLVSMASWLKGGALRAAVAVGASAVYQLVTSGNVSGQKLTATGLTTVLANLLRNEGTRAR
ncbi:MAG: hypothetical protein J2P25_04580 [Nocardiopsaceae bacterium]|nr:hypothetical protein [Nocardiopsaceae bacterium]